MISLATSLVSEKVRDNIQSALDENRLGGGRFIKEFEDKVKEYMGAKHAIAVCNGTMADMVSIASLKALRPDKKEVIVPALTFTAQVAAVIHNGLTPVFVDVTKDYQMNLEKVEDKINENTLGIMAVHLLGKECDIVTLQNIAKRNDVLLMEDCCESFGGTYSHDGNRFGTGSACGTFSFFPSHTITTGEGGMVITNDDQVAELARKIMNHGRMSDEIKEKFHFTHLGFNGKISNILAAIGSAVVSEADGVIKKRRKNVEYLNEHLKKDWYASSPHCYPIMTEQRDLKLEFLEKKGVEARKLFSCLPTQEQAYKYLGYKEGDFPMAEKIGREGLFLPIHQDLTEDDLEKIWSLI